MMNRRRSDRGIGGTDMQLRLQEHEQESEDIDELRRQCQRELFRMAARRVRETFEETTWQAFWMTAVQGISVADVAASLSLTVGAVYTARSRVMRRLQGAVQRLSREEQSLLPLSEKKEVEL